MDGFFEATKQIEAFTAGRFYGEEKGKIITLIAQINNLSDAETRELSELCLNKAIGKLNTLQAVCNGLVMLECKKDVDRVKALLTARKKELSELERNPKWSNREEWLKYLNGKSMSIDRRIEKAMFLYVKGDKENARAVFDEFAEACHIFSLQACRVISRELNDGKSEMRYLVILERVYDELLALPFPEEMQNRMAELEADGFIKSDVDVIIDYFDENNLSRMVFKA